MKKCSWWPPPQPHLLPQPPPLLEPLLHPKHQPQQLARRHPSPLPTHHRQAGGKRRKKNQHPPHPLSSAHLNETSRLAAVCLCWVMMIQGHREGKGREGRRGICAHKCGEVPGLDSALISTASLKVFRN
mmetsp:Transcript_22058/g.61078  ORF Transcript_22058/g.61078 Transcript_22058/m.61078 type:complete len:129 (-) Transcript_22058:138-524(-)